MKYIVCKLESGLEKIFVFDRSINHDEFFECALMIRFFGERDDWFRVGNDCIGAGFVNSSNQCYGESYTLGVSSRGDVDTRLLKESLGG